MTPSATPSVPALAEARTLGDVMRWNAEQRPDKTAFATLDGRTLGFGAFDRRVNQGNHVMQALGLRPGARVAVLARNRVEMVEAFGLTKSGLVVVPLNWRLAPAELLKILQHCAPDALIVDEHGQKLVEPLRGQLPGGLHLLSFDAAPSGWRVLADLMSSAPAHEDPSWQAVTQEIACIVYTSGTTGASKGAALTHDGLLDNARTAATEMLDLDATDQVMAVMPLFHVGGMWYHLFPCFAAGCSTLLLSEFDAGVVLRELQDRRITNVHLVPTMIAALLDHPDAAHADLGAVRMLFYAASSMPPELLRRAMQRFPACGFAQGYGATETGVLTVLGPEDHRRAREAANESLLASCGRPFSQREMRVVDDAGQPLPIGAVGEIQVRSPGRMRGYWQDAQATDRVLYDGWLRTGDLGRRDDDGYYYIVDRRNDMIVTGGENVYPSEVEAALCADQDVHEASVFGLPDPHWVEKVAAAIVLRPGAAADPQALLQRLRTRLAPYKCPKTIFLTDALPKNPVGKVLRKALRERYEGEPR
jgi:long-chain acyl-CoA synthetase